MWVTAIYFECLPVGGNVYRDLIVVRGKPPINDTFSWAEEKIRNGYSWFPEISEWIELQTTSRKFRK